MPERCSPRQSSSSRKRSLAFSTSISAAPEAQRNNPQSVRNDGAGRVDEALRMAEVRGIGNISGATDAKVVAVVCLIRQVERLGEQLQVHTVAELNVFCQTHIELKERIATERIVFGDGQWRQRDPQLRCARSVKAVLKIPLSLCHSICLTRRPWMGSAICRNECRNVVRPIEIISDISGRDEDSRSRPSSGVQGIVRIC